jgi:hypothetical protein
MLTYVAKTLLNGLSKIRGSIELGYCGFQQPIFQIVKFVCTEKASTNKHNTKFNIAQVVDILLWN